MITDLIQSILNYSHIHNKILINCINIGIYDNVYIYESDNGFYQLGITQEVIMQKKFSKLKKICLNNNTYIENLNHLADTLEVLHCGYNSAITQKGISKLVKLKNFDAKYNTAIYDVNHMSSLVELHCDGNCGINQNGIKNLTNLKILYANDNKHIYNVNHLSETLEKLYCGFESGIDQNGIANMTKLHTLYAKSNEKIKSVNHLSNILIYLDCSSNSGITQEGIIELNKLCTLNMYNNDRITYIYHLSHCLEKLYIDKHNVQINNLNIDQFVKKLIINVSMY